MVFALTVLSRVQRVLTYWRLNKMVPTLQTPFSNAFLKFVFSSKKKNVKIRLQNGGLFVLVSALIILHFLQSKYVQCHTIMQDCALLCRRCIMTSSNGNIFRITGPWWGESNGHQRIPLTRASGAELSYFIFICAWTSSGWANNRDAGDLRRHRAHYDVIVMGNVDDCHTGDAYKKVTLTALPFSG